MGTAKFIIGLTGGFASGKSTISRMLADYGFYIIDADDVARDVVKPGSEILNLIVKRWGDEILDYNGMLDRQKLASIVFTDEDERVELEKMLHPLIIAAMLKLASESKAEMIIFVAPLLIESGLNEKCDLVMALTAPDEVKIKRAMGKYDNAGAIVEKRIRAQISDDERNKKADFIINTDCSMDDLKTRVDDIMIKIFEIIQERRGKT